MRTDDFDYDLPEALIAQFPPEHRRDARLLVLPQSGMVHDSHIHDLGQYLRPGDCLVLNESRVMPARLFGQKETGGQIELLVERMQSPHHARAMIKSSRAPKPGSRLRVNDFWIKVHGRDEALFKLELLDKAFSWHELMRQFGHMPLPPYIHRDDNQTDLSRYQTVFAKTEGSAAAPTAGLHFDQAMLDSLSSLGVNICYVTLHVGLGTFKPVQVDKLDEHVMHSEWLDVPQSTVDMIQQTQSAGGRIVAVGTTCVRSLETAALQGSLKAFQGESQLFIYPGFKFNVVDALITNFHLPKSTLLMLVSAFSGAVRIKKAYQHAVDQQYRFFSYGDAMFLDRYSGE